MKVLIVIPARYASTRFPGKILTNLLGRPLIEWVWRGMTSSQLNPRVIIATDHPQVTEVCRRFGAEVRQTAPECPSGTDRVATVLTEMQEPWDWVVNVQGDEPLLTGAVVDELVRSLHPEDKMGTLARPLRRPDDWNDANVVKVARAADGRALYFSRAPIPYSREPGESPTERWHHIGIYAYRPDTLMRLVSLPPSPLEQCEKLEQLRALENGIAIRVVPTSYEAFGVDVPEDLERVAQVIQRDRLPRHSA